MKTKFKFINKWLLLMILAIATALPSEAAQYTGTYSVYISAETFDIGTGADSGDVTITIPTITTSNMNNLSIQVRDMLGFDCDTYTITANLSSMTFTLNCSSHTYLLQDYFSGYNFHLRSFNTSGSLVSNVTKTGTITDNGTSTVFTLDTNKHLFIYYNDYNYFRFSQVSFTLPVSISTLKPSTGATTPSFTAQRGDGTTVTVTNNMVVDGNSSSSKALVITSGSGETIYYTTDGTDPQTNTSGRKSVTSGGKATLDVDGLNQVRARSFKNNQYSSMASVDVYRANATQTVSEYISSFTTRNYRMYVHQDLTHQNDATNPYVITYVRGWRDGTYEMNLRLNRDGLTANDNYNNIVMAGNQHALTSGSYELYLVYKASNNNSNANDYNTSTNLTGTFDDATNVFTYNCNMAYYVPSYSTITTTTQSCVITMDSGVDAQGVVASGVTDPYFQYSGDVFDGGISDQAESITVHCATEGATIQYKIDNGSWTNISNGGSITLNQTCTVYARSSKNNETSNVVSADFYLANATQNARVYDIRNTSSYDDESYPLYINSPSSSVLRAMGFAGFFEHADLNLSSEIGSSGSLTSTPVVLQTGVYNGSSYALQDIKYTETLDISNNPIVESGDLTGTWTRSNGTLTMTLCPFILYDLTTSVFDDNAYGNNVITLTGIANEPVISASNGTVTITNSNGASIFYSTDGTTYQAYSQPFVVYDDCTVYAYAQLNNSWVYNSGVVSQAVEAFVPPTITFSPASGSMVASGTEIEISTDYPGELGQDYYILWGYTAAELAQQEEDQDNLISGDENDDVLPEITSSNLTVYAAVYDYEDNKLVDGNATYTLLPDHIYLFGDANGIGWHANNAVTIPLDNTTGTYKATVNFTGNGKETVKGQYVDVSWFYFSFVKANDDNDGGWGYVNGQSIRPNNNGDNVWIVGNNAGANSTDFVGGNPISIGNNTGGSFMIPSDNAYEVEVDLNAMTLRVRAPFTMAQLLNKSVTCHNYTISNDVVAVAAVTRNNETYFVVKDENGATASANTNNYTDYNAQYGIQSSPYDHSNWMLIKTESNLEGKRLAAGTVTGSFDGNHTLTLTSTPTMTSESYTPNIYTPANFYGTQQGASGNYYFFATPQPYELCDIQWAVYMDNNEFAVIGQQTNEGYSYNQGNLKGGFSIAWDYYPANASRNLTPGTIYDLESVLLIPSSGSGAPRRVSGGDGTNNSGLVVYPTTPIAAGIVTGIEGIYAGKAVKAVRYYNVAGMESDKPFEGVNVVVTEFNDGTKATTKVVR